MIYILLYVDYRVHDIAVRELKGLLGLLVADACAVLDQFDLLKCNFHGLLPSNYKCFALKGVYAQMIRVISFQYPCEPLFQSLRERKLLKAP